MQTRLQLLQMLSYVTLCNFLILKVRFGSLQVEEEMANKLGEEFMVLLTGSHTVPGRANGR